MGKYSDSRAEVLARCSLCGKCHPKGVRCLTFIEPPKKVMRVEEAPVDLDAGYTEEPAVEEAEEVKEEVKEEAVSEKPQSEEIAEVLEAVADAVSDSEITTEEKGKILSEIDDVKTEKPKKRSHHKKPVVEES